MARVRYMELELVNGQLKEMLDFYLSQENLSYIISLYNQGLFVE